MSTTSKHNCQPASYHDEPQRREPVLIVARGDGWLEAHAERHVDVRIVQPPYVPGIEGELLAEEWLDQELPRRFADLRWPYLRRAADLHRVVRPSDILRRRWSLQALAALGETQTPARRG